MQSLENELLRKYTKGEINAYDLISQIIELEKKLSIVSEQREGWINKFNELKHPIKGCRHKWTSTYDINDNGNRVFYEVCPKCGEEKY